jgi:hypothetical protein
LHENCKIVGKSVRPEKLSNCKIVRGKFLHLFGRNYSRDCDTFLSHSTRVGQLGPKFKPLKAQIRRLLFECDLTERVKSLTEWSHVVPAPIFLIVNSFLTCMHSLHAIDVILTRVRKSGRGSESGSASGSGNRSDRESGRVSGVGATVGVVVRWQCSGAAVGRGRGSVGVGSVWSHK